VLAILSVYAFLYISYRALFSSALFALDNFCTLAQKYPDIRGKKQLKKIRNIFNILPKAPSSPPSSFLRAQRFTITFAVSTENETC